MATRRHDPERRQRIIQAALEVITDSGMAACTHRSVAARADVPLGSMTYHFDSREALLEEAFGLLSAYMLDKWREQLEGVDSPAQACAAIVDWVCGDQPMAADTLIPMMELYVYAARNAPARRLIGDWAAQVQQTLGQYFEPATVRALDAVIEGITLHNIYSGGTIARAEVEAIVARISAGGELPG
ncbi:hypothetical protein ABB30_05600 [Stenotrophomonas ginsengisoli]|uniref:HTH tetR-type domain-containing protein n=1 Tax=Stenotrophomonas ginsengisoli TaxID=336566 RepID=A0A0R0DJQ2_9GAMM|nr:hypothetical protein ABB30_05600 [Stenotrophomonas ginsengisoli]